VIDNRDIANKEHMMAENTPEEITEDAEVVAHTAEGTDEEDPTTCIGYYSSNHDA